MMRKTEIPNCATIRLLRKRFLPPVNEKPCFRTFRIFVPDKITAGYKPAKKLTSKESVTNAMIGTGRNMISAVNCFPATLLK